MSFYIGLSIVSTDHADRITARKHSSAEARRILALLHGSSPDTGIAVEDGGRPYFTKHESGFSMTHCGALTAVSYAKGKDLRTGCDAERIRPRSGAAAIAETFFSPNENNYLYKTGKFDYTEFYKIWTLKECFIKLKGLSVFDMPLVPSFISESLQFEFCPLEKNDDNPLPLFFRLYELSDSHKQFTLAAGFEGSEQPPEIIWFSQSSLVCKIIAEIKAAPRPAQTVSPKR